MRKFSDERAVYSGTSCRAGGGEWRGHASIGGLTVSVGPPRESDNEQTAIRATLELICRWNACADALAKLDAVALGGEALDARIILREAIMGIDKVRT